MEKIVVQYTGGSEYEPYEVVLCFEYESIEGWLCNFEDELKQARGNPIEHAQQIEEWEKRRPKVQYLRGRPTEEFIQWRKNRPRLNRKWKFQFCGFEFSTSDFEYKSSNERFGTSQGDIYLPEVYTLDDWFQMKLQER